MCSQERAISDTIAALGDGADHERNKHARNAKPLHPIHYFSIGLSMPFSPLGLAASRTSGPLTEDSERVTRHSDIGLEFLHRWCCWPEVAFWEMRPGQP